MKIGIANAAETDAIWPRFSARLQAACERTGGDISSGELWQMCRSGQAFCVVVFNDEGPKAILIMQFQKWVSKTVMRCLGIVGDGVDEWLPAARDFIANMAREGGATSFVAEGRDGWAKLFPDAKKLRITYEVSL
jgi:hypothetical protein